MPLRDEMLPAPMMRAAIVAPDTRLRRVLVEIADLGVFEPDPSSDLVTGPIDELVSRAVPTDTELAPLLSLEPLDPDELATAGQFELLLGEANIERITAVAAHTECCTMVPGWISAEHVEQARAAIEPHGGSIAELPGRRGVEPPTAYTDGTLGTSFRPLVTTYTTVPYRDLDPTLFAALAYMLMFGMMFGDVAHGAAIVAVGLMALTGSHDRLSRIRAAAPFLVGAGVAAIMFGLLYGEAFGPTGLVPTLWMRPLEEPEHFLLAGLAVGGVLLAVTMIGATINRWRERGAAAAIFDSSGLAGALMLFGLAGLVLGAAASTTTLRYVGISVAVVGAVLAFIGLIAKTPSGPAGSAEAVVEMFDTVLRLGSNVVSFARLAAFGLTHAVISEVVWDGTVHLWDAATVPMVLGAAALFVLGNLAAFALGALVAAVQALRLEYYELFSRLFVSQGRPFRPWHVPAQRMEPS